MTHSIALSLLLAFGSALSLGAPPLPAQEQIDRDMVAKIRTEGFENSHVMEVFNHLTNVIGPRLTNSPGYYEAVEFMRAKMIEWEFEDVHVEPWEFGRGWSLERFSVEMLEPRYLPMIGFPRGWSASTQGRLVFEPIMLGGKSTAELRSFEDRLGGAIVLTRPIETNFIREDRPQPRMEDRLTPPSPGPSVILAAEHYNLVARLLEQQIPVTVAVEVTGRY